MLAVLVAFGALGGPAAARAATAAAAAPAIAAPAAIVRLEAVCPAGAVTGTGVLVGVRSVLAARTVLPAGSTAGCAISARAAAAGEAVRVSSWATLAASAGATAAGNGLIVLTLRAGLVGPGPVVQRTEPVTVGLRVGVLAGGTGALRLLLARVSAVSSRDGVPELELALSGRAKAVIPAGASVFDAAGELVGLTAAPRSQRVLDIVRWGRPRAAACAAKTTAPSAICVASPAIPPPPPLPLLDSWFATAASPDQAVRLYQAGPVAQSVTVVAALGRRAVAGDVVIFTVTRPDGTAVPAVAVTPVPGQQHAFASIALGAGAVGPMAGTWKAEAITDGITTAATTLNVTAAPQAFMFAFERRQVDGQSRLFLTMKQVQEVPGISRIRLVRSQFKRAPVPLRPGEPGFPGVGPEPPPPATIAPTTPLFSSTAPPPAAFELDITAEPALYGPMEYVAWPGVVGTPIWHASAPAGS